MTCERQEQTILYLWDELEPDQMTVFREHLDRCPTCKEQVELLELLVRSMRSVKGRELPKETAQRLRARLDQALLSQSSGLRIGPLRALAVAASIALVVGLTIWFSNLPDKMPSSTETIAQQTDATMHDDDYIDDLALAIANDLETLDLQLSGHDSLVTADLYDLADQMDSLWQQVENESQQEESDNHPDNGQSFGPANPGTVKII